MVGTALETPAEMDWESWDHRRCGRCFHSLLAIRPQGRKGRRGKISRRNSMSRDTYLLPNGRVLRYSFRERLVHWVSGVSYVYLLLTGLAFWSPWLFWIAVVLGGGTISRVLHPWAGVIFFFSVLWMYAKWGPQMRSTERDKEWWHSLPHYIR